jgi:hypothetical protein
MNSVFLAIAREGPQTWDGLYKMQLIYDTRVQTVPDLRTGRAQEN